MKTNGGSGKPIEVLLVEDSPGDDQLLEDAALVESWRDWGKLSGPK
jgi:hypothetical protein